MILHKRTLKVQSVSAELEMLVLEHAEKNELTYGELVKCLSGILGTVAKLQIREERHPEDPDKKGDEA